jgi:hypothetical protein
MRRRITTIFLCITALLATKVSGANPLSLFASLHYDLNTDAYTNAYLHDGSSINVYQGGYLNRADLYDTATLRVLEYRYGTYGQSVGYASAVGSSRVVVTGGEVGTIYARENSHTDVSGGAVNRLTSIDTSTVGITSGLVRWLDLYDLRCGGSERVNISGGTVSMLSTSLIVPENEHFTLAADLSVSDLVSFGVKAVNGAVANIELTTMIAEGNSSLVIAGGTVGGEFHRGGLGAYGNSRVTITGGTVRSSLFVNENSHLLVTGGEILDRFWVRDTSSVDISGGLVKTLLAIHHSTVTFHGENFILGSGLWLDGNRLFGMGTLSGQWLDGTFWTTQISSNAETATILLIPEPATLALFALGGFWLVKRMR